MSQTRPLLPTRSVGLAVRRTLASIPEMAVLVGLVAALEALGPLVAHDGLDLIVMSGLVLVSTVIGRAARAGWMPLTRRAGGALATWARTVPGRLTPRYAVAFRPSTTTSVSEDRTLLLPITLITGALVLFASLGNLTFIGLLFLKTSVSYTLNLLCLATIWSVLAATVVVGSFIAGRWIQETSRSIGPGLPLVLFAAAWVTGLVLLTLLPGSAPLIALLLLGIWYARALREIPQQYYLFCRRDAEGQARSLPVYIYLRRLYTAVVLILALVVVLGQGQRLWVPMWPVGPFAFTTWIGVLGSLCALLIVGRLGAQLQRVVGGAEVPPETPLTPILWMRIPPHPENPEMRAAREGSWRETARESGWLVFDSVSEPSLGHDLVLGGPASPRRFDPREPLNPEDARFLLERRLNVVMRRRFHRHFQSLYKRVRAIEAEGGSGFLFCPHSWLVPGVVRDTEPGQLDGEPNLSLGPRIYGPPYANAFAPRVRRYIGGVLRDLEIDIIYFEDGVTWKDIRRVLGIAFEIYDQRRSPLRDRHFTGLPRLRVMIQEEPADPDPKSLSKPGEPDPFAPQAAGHARVLLILRDRGQGEEDKALDPVDSRIRTPSLV